MPRIRGVKQTVLVKKTAARTRAAAAKLARRHADRIYTARETKNYWRFRQRPPDCFVKGRRFRTFCIPPGRSVCVVYGRIRKGAEKRRACR
jgi:hypothetical protein